MLNGLAQFCDPASNSQPVPFSEKARKKCSSMSLLDGGLPTGFRREINFLSNQALAFI